MKKFMLFSIFLVAGQFVCASQNSEVSVMDTVASAALVVGTYGATSLAHEVLINCAPGNGFDRTSKVDVAFSRISGAAAVATFVASAVKENEAAKRCACVLMLSMLGHTVYKSFSMPQRPVQQ